MSRAPRSFSIDVSLFEHLDKEESASKLVNDLLTKHFNMEKTEEEKEQDLIQQKIEERKRQDKETKLRTDFVEVFMRETGKEPADEVIEKFVRYWNRTDKANIFSFIANWEKEEKE